MGKGREREREGKKGKRRRRESEGEGEEKGRERKRGGEREREKKGAREERRERTQGSNFRWSGLLEEGTLDLRPAGGRGWLWERILSEIITRARALKWAWTWIFWGPEKRSCVWQIQVTKGPENRSEHCFK